MKAINYEIFDDLLIGNFMRTTFFGLHSLYDFDFNPLLTKYADNGKAKTEEEVHRYINEYKKDELVEIFANQKNATLIQI